MTQKGNVIEIKSKCVRLCSSFASNTCRFTQDLVHGKKGYTIG